MKDFTTHELIKKAARRIIKNYYVGYTDIEKNILFISSKKYKPGQKAYNIMNPDCFLFTPELVILYDEIDRYTFKVETYLGELDHYNNTQKNACITALLEILKKHYIKQLKTA